MMATTARLRIATSGPSTSSRVKPISEVVADYPGAPISFQAAPHTRQLRSEKQDCTRGPRFEPLVPVAETSLLVDLDVASFEGLLAGIVGWDSTQANAVRVGSFPGLRHILHVDPVEERAGAVDRRRAEDAR